MLSKAEAVLLSEPSGRRIAVVMFAGAIVMSSIYIYFDLLRDGSSVHSIVMAVGFALSGIAESLPKERRRLAGGLRISAILVLLGFIGLTLFAPEIILGPR